MKIEDRTDGSHLSRSQSSFHGGLNSLGRRKVRRPLSYRLPIHLSLKSIVAIGTLSLAHARNRNQVKSILRRQAIKHRVELSTVLNFGNQIQLVIRVENRKDFQSFLRSATALIARKVTGACKGNRFGSFWSGLARTRILPTANDSERIIRFFRLMNLRIQRAKSLAERNSRAIELWLSTA